MFVVLTSKDAHSKFAIRAQEIRFVTEYPGSVTKVTFLDGDSIGVLEPIELVVEFLNAAEAADA